MGVKFEEKKIKAVEYMKMLDIYKPYINGFKAKQSKVCYFERFGGYWAWQNDLLTQKIKEIQEKYSCCVYAVTHEHTEMGECYSFLIVTDYKEEWPETIKYLGGRNFEVFAYVWNVEDDNCSEFGDIVVQSMGGGIRRIA